MAGNGYVPEAAAFLRLITALSNYDDPPGRARGVAEREELIIGAGEA